MSNPTIILPPKNPPLMDSDQYLWHFTTPEGLSKILLEKDGLLAGHALFMKDTEDCSLLRRLNKIEVGLGSLLVKGFYRNVDVGEAKDCLKRMAESGLYRSVFITCFSTTTEEPRMWTEYTNNGGFAIGFDKKLLERELGVSQKDGQNSRFWDKCDYLSFSNTLHEMEKLEAKLSIIEQHGSTGRSTGNLVQSFMDCREMTRGLIFSKVPELSWENEKRLAYVFEQGNIPDNRLRFVNGKPFVTIDLSEHISNYVRCIRISPFGDVAKSRAIAQLVGTAIGLDLTYVVDERME